MASISFNQAPPVTKPAATTVEVETVPAAAEPARDKEEVSSTIAVIEPKPLAVSQPAPQVAEGITGEVSYSDLKPPRIHVVQKVGNLSNDFQPGSLVFEKSVVLTTGKTPVDITPLKLRKYYQQKLPWGGSDGERPILCNTVAEVRENGGSLEFGDDNYYQQVADIMVAIKLPADTEGDEVIDLFPYQLGEDFFAVAIWTVASSGYTAVAKPLLTAAASLLRNGLYHGHYNVTTEVKKNAMNSWYAPRLMFAGKHTAEAAAFFKEIAGI